MPYWQAYYHLVWTTRERQALIVPEIERMLYAIIRKKCEEKGGLAFVVNGMPDHVHVVTTIPPKVAASDFVGFVKGASSYVVQASYDLPFAWQRGYGLFTLSRRSLSQAIAYVQQQKEHHEAGTAIPALERVADDTDARLRRSTRRGEG